MPIWNPNQYLKFKNERTRPARDLISHVDLEAPGSILDVGCGPGNSTAALRSRWPGARIVGIDNSPEMIASAKESSPTDEWILADAATHHPREPYDLVFSNAALQWMPDHEILLPRLFEWVAPGGALAIQVPAMDGFPIVKAVAAVTTSSIWRDRFSGADRVANYQSPEYYFQILQPLGPRLDLWQTVYYHVLASQAALIEWYRGASLKPFLDRLPDDAARRTFEAEVLREMAPHYPVQPDGHVLFPFRRTFFILYKSI